MPGRIHCLICLSVYVYMEWQRHHSVYNSCRCHVGGTVHYAWRYCTLCCCIVASQTLACLKSVVYRITQQLKYKKLRTTSTLKNVHVSASNLGVCSHHLVYFQHGGVFMTMASLDLMHSCSVWLCVCFFIGGDTMWTGAATVNLLPLIQCLGSFLGKIMPPKSSGNVAHYSVCRQQQGSDFH